MALSLNNYPSPPSATALYKLKKLRENPLSSSSLLQRCCSTSVGLWNYNYRSRNGVKALFFSPKEEPIIKEALKEPVAFVGGVFAGLLRLDLNEDPLKEWVTRTVEASGITEEETDAGGSKPEQVPEQIEIE